MKKTYKIISAVMALIMLAVCMTVGSSAASSRVLVDEGYWYSYSARIVGDHGFEGNIKVEVALGVPAVYGGYELRVDAYAVVYDDNHVVEYYDIETKRAGYDDKELYFSFTFENDYDAIECDFWGFHRKITSETYS